MMVPILLALGALSSASISPLALRAEATGGPDGVKLADLVDLSTLPPTLADRAAGLLIWRSADGRASVDTDSRAVAARARALLPALAPYLPADAPSRPIRLHAAVPSPAPTSTGAPPGGDCFRILTDVATDAAPSAESVQKTDCRQVTASRAWRYGRLGLTAARPLKSGEVVRAPWPDALPVVRRGDTVTVGVDVGPVRLQRDMRALQDGRPGAPFFLLTPEGEVLRATAPELAR